MPLRRKRSRDNWRIGTWLFKAFDKTILAVASVAGIFLVLEAIDPTRRLLDKSVFNLDQAGLVAIVALMLEVTIVAIYQLSSDVRKLRTDLIAGSAEVIQDTGEFYAILRNHLNSVSGLRNKKLEVLGMSLDNAWPRILEWLRYDQPTGWQITMYSLAPEFTRENQDLPSRWADEAIRIRKEIEYICETDSIELDDRRIAITLKAYRSYPAIHGFRIGGKDVFASFIQWGSRSIVQPFQFYEHFRSSDSSIRAKEYRQLFDNWIKRIDGKSELLCEGPSKGSSLNYPRPDRSADPSQAL
jgi:hypothetical protein